MDACSWMSMRRTKMKIKLLIGIILTIGGFIGAIICAIAAIIFYFQNPDMTGLRRFIEYPAPSIWAIICFVCEKIGLDMIGSKKRY